MLERFHGSSDPKSSVHVYEKGIGLHRMFRISGCLSRCGKAKPRRSWSDEANTTVSFIIPRVGQQRRECSRAAASICPTEMLLLCYIPELLKQLRLPMGFESGYRSSFSLGYGTSAAIVPVSVSSDIAFFLYGGGLLGCRAARVVLGVPVHDCACIQLYPD